MKYRLPAIQKLLGNKQTIPAVVVIVSIAFIGIYALLAGHAASPFASSTANSGQLAGGATAVNTAGASDGTAVKFNGIAPVSGCGLAQVAFCDNFSDEGALPAVSRSGPLAEVWGVSRFNSSSNFGQGINDNWSGVYMGTTNDATTGSSICGPLAVVMADNDLKICDDELIDSLDDAGYQPILAMYPRQPFNFAGRTGTVVFGMSDNTQGGHAAWPAFAITDQPVPAPYSDTLAGMTDYPRNSVGVSFGSACVRGSGSAQCVNVPSGSNWTDCVNVQSITETVNYVPKATPFTEDSCVMPSTALNQINNVKITINSNGMDVYMSDAGNPASLRLVANSSFTPPLTEGLIWLEDVHYNADKYDGDPDGTPNSGTCTTALVGQVTYPPCTDQQENSFAWTNVGFDGPIEPRDLAFDVADSKSSDFNASYERPAHGEAQENLGYQAPDGGSFTVNVQSVTSANLAAASGALMVFNYKQNGIVDQTMLLSVNGKAAVDADLTSSDTIAVALPLGDLQPGTNTFTFSEPGGDGGVNVANIDLILQGAGGIVDP
jgi:hypothetical protein